MKTWLTEYLVNGVEFGGDVEAESWADAQARCDARGAGEVVVGELIEDIPVDLDVARVQVQRGGVAKA